MNNVQEHLLELLVEIDELCSEHGLTYYLAGGSLIGAMRNHGFLPWDDDADIHMTRKDALKLLELSHKGLLPPNRALVSYHDYPDTPMIHWRYMDTSTTVILRSTYTTHVPQGQFVDIFVLNPAPSEDSDRDKFVEDFNLYWDLFCNHVIDSRRSESLLARYRFWTRMRHIGFEKYMHRYFRSRLFELPEDSSDEYSIMGPWVPKPFWKKEIFGKPKRVPFENTFLCVAGKPEEMLFHAYGSSWVEVPEMQERESHVFVIDLDLPFKYALRDMDAVTNRFKDGKLSWKWKNDWFAIIHNRNYVNPKTHQIQLILRAKEFAKDREESQIDFDEALSSHSFDAIKLFYKDYYSLQMGGNTSYWGLFVPINDDMLWEAWYCRYMLGDYSRTLKIIDKRKNWSDEPLSSKLEELEALCNDADAVVAAVWTTGETEVAEEIVTRRLQDPDCSVLFYRARLALDVPHCESDDDLARITEFADSALAQYPNDGELAYWKAELLEKAGNYEDARMLYQVAAKRVVNGLLQTRAKEALSRIG